MINDLAYESDKEEIRRRGKIVDRVTTSVATWHSLEARFQRAHQLSTSPSITCQCNLDERQWQGASVTIREWMAMSVDPTCPPPSFQRLTLVHHAALRHFQSSLDPTCPLSSFQRLTLVHHAALRHFQSSLDPTCPLSSFQRLTLVHHAARRAVQSELYRLDCDRGHANNESMPACLL